MKIWMWHVKGIKVKGFLLRPMGLEPILFDTRYTKCAAFTLWALADANSSKHSSLFLEPNVHFIKEGSKEENKPTEPAPNPTG